jgi:hypothetical protein
MATLTPLSKGLIGLAVIGAVVSAVWNLGLKEFMAKDGGSVSGSIPSSSTVPVRSLPPQAAPMPETLPPPAAETSAAPSAPSSAAPVATAGGKALTAAESGEKGRQYLDAGDYPRARIFLEQAVKMGDGPAACHLGEMTLKGKGGIVADRDKSAALFQLAQSRGMICFASGN